MPKFFVIGRTWIRHSAVAAAAMVDAGEIVEYDGDPGATMVALDADALVAKQRFADRRHPRVRSLDERNEGRMRAGLSTSQKLHLAALEAALPTIHNGEAP